MAITARAAALCDHSAQAADRCVKRRYAMLITRVLAPVLALVFVATMGAAAFAPPAHAFLAQNGYNQQGRDINGITRNGGVVGGGRPNGLSSNGMPDNGTAVSDEAVLGSAQLVGIELPR